MGFLNRSQKNSKHFDSPKSKKMTSLPTIQCISLPNGNLQIDFYDDASNFQKFYDTTRLLIYPESLNLAGHPVRRCAVSWYGRDDCQFFNEETGKFEYLSAQDYQEVLAEFNLELLLNNPDYCKVLMNGLLDKKRVERYLSSGLQESPEYPCGNYIGGIRESENGYGKFFSMAVGQTVHNSTYMKDKRTQYKQMQEKKKQNSIAEKKSLIEQLQKEIEDMER